MKSLENNYKETLAIVLEVLQFHELIGIISEETVKFIELKSLKPI